MLTPTVVHRTSLVALVTGMIASATWAEEPVDLKAKFPPGHTRFVETDTEVQATSTSPMGEFEMTVRAKTGVLRKATSRGNETTLSLTIDRASLTFDTAMGGVFLRFRYTGRGAVGAVGTDSRATSRHDSEHGT